MDSATEVGPSRQAAVAVVAVHGVADHLPRTTARAVADLLHRTADANRYGAFAERTLRIALRPVEPNKATGTRQEARSVGALFRIDERASHLRRADGAPVDVSDAFMCEQLVQYRSALDSYDTIRLEGECTADGTRVHVHEVYWADLSRQATGGLRVFGEIFQIMFHLPTLGRKAVEYARLQNRKDPVWTLYALMQRVTERVLTIGVPVLGMALLSVALTLFTIAVPAPGRIAAFSAMAGGMTGVLFTTLAYLASRDPGAWRVWSGPVAGAAIGLFVSFALDPLSEIALGVLVVEWTLFASLIVLYALVRYDRLRPGALVFGLIVQLATATNILVPTATSPDDKTMAISLLTVADHLWVALDATTYVFVGLLSVTALAGIVALFRIRENQQEYTRCAGACWTGALSLALPGALLGLLTILIWTVVMFGTLGAVRDEVRCAPYSSDWPSITHLVKDQVWRELDETPGQRAVEHATERPIEHARGPLCAAAPSGRNLAAAARAMPMALAGATFLLPPAAVLLLLLSLPAVVLPAIFADRDLRPDQPPNRAKTIRLGAWLDGGYQLAAWLGSGTTLAFALYLGIGLYRVSLTGDAYDWTASLDGWATTIMSTAAAAALGTIAARGWLPGLRATTGILLDVDGYLREHPRDGTPRARIAERFVSVLRYLKEHGDGGRPYDAVIIVSHSQGTVIAADLLRFLHHYHDPVLGDRPWDSLHLLTMGSPLRQLYASCFPHLYHWVTEDKRAPDPSQLGLDSWTNVYRSGDYIGRYLWSGVDPWNLDRMEISADRFERCLGPGAHTRYWDSAGTDVAVELDRIIRLVAEVRGKSSA
jgi:hypothetical protein